MKISPEWKRLHGVADSNIKALEVVFLMAIGELQKNIKVDELIRGNKDKAIPWYILESELQKIKPILLKILIEAGEITADNFEFEEILKAKKKKKIPFKRTNKQLIKYVNEYGDVLIAELMKETRSSVDFLVREIKDPVELANALKQFIGLTEKQTMALRKLDDEMRAKGLNRRVRTRTLNAEYYKKLSYRAEMIARTESINAANQGQLEHWRDVANQGYIDINVAMKEWVVTPDDRLCSICAPLSGERVKINQPFSWGGMRPTRHPQCRCAMKLIKYPVKDEEG